MRLNTNESPLPPPKGWYEALQAGIAEIPFNRYPDREATELRAALAASHGVEPERDLLRQRLERGDPVPPACLRRPGTAAAVFEPTYTLHRHIARITATEVAIGRRGESFELDLDEVRRVLTTCVTGGHLPLLAEQPDRPGRAARERPRGGAASRPGPGGRRRGLRPVRALVRARAASRTGERGPSELVVVRTFSKTWSMAAGRLGYLIGSPEVVQACESVALPYHLDAVTQLAGRLALDFVDEMEARIALSIEERGRLAAGLADLPVQAWPSDANFILFRPSRKEAKEVWSDLLAESVLVRDCSSWPGLEGCLRVTVGLPEENDRFLAALRESL